MDDMTWPTAEDEDELERLRVQFPDFALSAELGRDRWRYLARSRHRRLNPWVVITGDLDELRSVLLQAFPIPSAPVNDAKSTHPYDQRPR
jgi:hypothetical protein